jgi:hypothetical protein
MKKSPFRSLSLAPLALVCIALVLASGARGDVPRTISYQGFLTDDAGAPLTGPVDITFRLFGQLADGTEAWSEVHQDVELDEGRFTVALGGFTAQGVDFSQQMFLEIQVGDEVLAPRLPMRSVPSAIRAATVDAGAVDTAALAAGAVTKAKLGDDLVGAGLAQNEDGSLKIALGKVDGTMLAAKAVTNSHVADTADIDPTKIAGTAVTLGGTEALTNKTLTNPVLQVRDSDFTIVDDDDPGYSVRLQLSAVGRASRLSRTLIVPDADGTLALESYVDAEIDGLATVAASGAYADLLGLPALQPVATSGEFSDIANMPDFARRDTANTFTAPASALSLAPVGAASDAVLLEVLDSSTRTGTQVFSVDAEGDVVAKSFTGRGYGLQGLRADQIMTGTVNVNRLPTIPSHKVVGFADIAISGDFYTLNDVPNFAERDAANTFTESDRAISLEPSHPDPDAVLLQVLSPDERLGSPVFAVDAEGDVFAESFTGDGSGLMQLNADSLTSGTVSLAVLPTIPSTMTSGFALIATSGSFLDLAAVPAFARRDEENAFTASIRAISLEPADPKADDPMLQLLGSTGERTGLGSPVFVVDAEGDVTATSVSAGTFDGDGAGLTDLDADKVTSGVLALAHLPSIPGSQIDPDAVVSGTIEDGTIVNDDIATDADIDFSKLNIPNGDITNNLLDFDSFDVSLGPNFMAGFRTSTSVQLGGTLDLSLDTANLAGDLAGWGLMAAGGSLAINLPELTPSLATSLPGKGLSHDANNDTIAVDLGDGLKLAAGNLVVPDVDDLTIEVDGGGKLAVKSVDSVPVVLDMAEPTVPKHGSLIYKDSVLQVFDDPDGVGGDPGVWIKVGTYQ